MCPRHHQLQCRHQRQFLFHHQHLVVNEVLNCLGILRIGVPASNGGTRTFQVIA
jgi:hypothetical protein